MQLVILVLVLIAIVIGIINLVRPVKTGHLTRQISELSGKLDSMQQGQSYQRQELSSALNQLSDGMTTKFDEKFAQLQASNEKKLADIQTSVDEKLQETLKRSISQSFEQVQNQLKSVEQGLGQMRNLASDVGSLSKVMSGVKTRGIIGELQLDQLLSEILPQGQYREQENIQGANAVDFAVVLPGKTDNDEVLLPIDSKFPLDDYQRLLDATEINDKEQIEHFRKELLARVKAFAKDIAKKYILPPKTTDFAILFLPTEGLFLEVVNGEHGSFIDSIRREFKVNITGPTTMTAVLNSLQMGFKTLQVEKQSTEVFNLLTSVRNEFDNYEKALSLVEKDLAKSHDDITKLMTTRTNKMNVQLRKVEALDNTQEK